MKAITTRYFGTTEKRESCIHASDDEGNRVIVGYDQTLSSEAMHLKAARALCSKMHWTGRMIEGTLKHGHVFVFAEYRAGHVLIIANYLDVEVTQ